MTTIINQPDVSIALQSANTLVSNTPQRILCVGQKTASGSATAGTLVENIQNDGSEDALFGPDSMLANMVRNVRLYNKVTRVDAIVLADNGSNFGAGSFNITGSATEAGTITFNIGGTEYAIGVASGDSATVIGDALEAAVTADTRSIVGASNTTGTVTITAKNAGVVGNTIGLSRDQVVDGVSVSVLSMAGGNTDPVLTSVFDPIEDERYQTIIWPYSDLDTVKNFLDARFNTNSYILDGVAFYGVDNTFSVVEALGQGHNSQSLVIVGDEIISSIGYEAGAIQTVPYIKATQVAAIRALRLTDGAAIGDLVISRDGSLDRFGGIALASYPYFNTPVRLLPLVDTDKGWSNSEIESLLDAGVSVLGNNIANNEILMGEMVTTYKTDTAGNPDPTFTFLNYVDTSSNIREFYYNNLRARFAQSRLTEGSLHVGRAEANGALIEAFCTQLYQELANNVLVQDGETALQFYKENLVVTLDLATGTVTIQMQVPIVTQLRRIIATIQIAFSAEG